MLNENDVMVWIMAGIVIIGIIWRIVRGPKKGGQR